MIWTYVSTTPKHNIIVSEKWDIILLKILPTLVQGSCMHTFNTMLGDEILP